MNNMLMKNLENGIISENDYVNLAELFAIIIKQITPKASDRERLVKVMTGEIIETTVSKLEATERLLTEKDLLLDEKNTILEHKNLEIEEKDFEIAKLKKQIELLTSKKS